MNRKQVGFLLILLVVLGAAGLFLRKKENTSWTGGGTAMGQKLLGAFSINDVAHITIKQETNELDLIKKDDLWRVRQRNDYPADYAQISQLMIKLRDLKIAQSEKIGPSQLPRFQLAPAGQGTNSATVAEFKDQNEKPIRMLLLGRKHLNKTNRPSPGGMTDEGWADGRYVKTAADQENVAVIRDPLDNIEPKPELWLDKEFFKIEKPRSIAVVFPNTTNSWKLTRESESGEWKLADAKPGEQLDSSKIAGVSNPFGSPAFTDVSPAAEAQKAGMGKPAVVTVDTFDDFAYTLTIGGKTNDDYLLGFTVAAHLPKERAPGKDEKPEDRTRLDKEFQDNQKKLEARLAHEKKFENWIYLVSNWTVEPVLKERSQLLVEKKEEPQTSENGSTNAVNSNTNSLSPPDGSKQ